MFGLYYNRMNTITSPGQAKNAITVGSTNSIYYKNPHTKEYVAYFSSRGNPKDKRVLPDITAPGVMYSAASLSEKACGKNCNDHNTYVLLQGTYPLFYLFVCPSSSSQCPPLQLQEL